VSEARALPPRNPSDISPRFGPGLELVDERRAAAILGWSTSTLQKDRGQRRRIAYVKLGSRVMYRLSDLRDYVEANVRR
jgi:hypothetical protein